MVLHTLLRCLSISVAIPLRDLCIVAPTILLLSQDLSLRPPPRHQLPPAFAYYISGGPGDGDRLLRLLLAVYHPRNRYLLHIGIEGSDDDRRRLAALVKFVPAIRAFGNVDVVGTYMGSLNIAVILRAAAILLKVDGG